MNEKASKDAITQRVIEFINKNNLSETKFAKEIGIGQSTLNKQLRVCGVTTETISMILMRYPEVSAEWLMRGKDEQTKEEPERKNEDTLVNIEAVKLQAQVDLLYKVIDKLTK